MQNAHAALAEVESVVASAEATKAAPKLDDAALTAMDQNLANDIDALLQGDFESIDAVLEGAFDESATENVLDAKAGTSAQPDAKPSLKGKEIHSPASTSGPLPSAPAKQTMVSPSAVSQANSSSEDAFAEDASFEAPADLAETSDASEIETPAVVSSVSANQIDANSSDAKLESLNRVEENNSASAIASASGDKPACSVASQKDKAASIEDSANQQTRTTILERIAKPVIKLLMMANFPLRSFSSPQRSIVNFVAITLVAWVPIVWMLGKSGFFESAPPSVAAHKKEAAKHESSGHGESGHAEKASEKSHGDSSKHESGHSGH